MLCRFNVQTLNLHINRKIIIHFKCVFFFCSYMHYHYCLRTATPSQPKKKYLFYVRKKQPYKWISRVYFIYVYNFHIYKLFGSKYSKICRDVSRCAARAYLYDALCIRLTISYVCMHIHTRTRHTHRSSSIIVKYF